MKQVITIASVFFLTLVHVKGQEDRNTCNAAECVPPECYCATNRIPNDLDPNKVPQMIIFSFSGTLARGEGEYLDDLFNPKRRNPNGSPIRMTLFVSDDDGATDYCTVSNFWAKGHEIASFSVSRRTPPYWWVTATQSAWESEIEGQKQNIVDNTTIPADHIVGFRSPYLQPGGNVQYRFAVANGYEYDSSIILPRMFNEESRPKLWPYTMDFPNGLNCDFPPCPTGSFPGLYQIPVHQLTDSYGTGCNYLTNCINKPEDAGEIFDILMKSFNRSYNNNRVPMMVNFLNYKDFFDNNYPWALDGVNRFINEVLAYAADDVWFVTYQDVIAWMKNPTENRVAGYTKAFMGPEEGEREKMSCIERRTAEPLFDGKIFLVLEIFVCLITFIALYVKDNK